MPLDELIPADYRAQAEVRLKQATAEVGLPYQRGEIVPNTHLAHEAALEAEHHGLGDAFHRAVLRRYFGEAGEIGSIDELVAIAIEVGLPADAMRDALTSRRHRAAVDAAIADTRHLGITAVPTFGFEDAGVLSGAQPYAVFEGAMKQLGVARKGA